MTVVTEMDSYPPQPPPKLIYPSVANQDKVLHISFKYLMQKKVVLRVPAHSTIKLRGEHFSAAFVLIQHTW